MKITSKITVLFCLILWASACSTSKSTTKSEFIEGTVTIKLKDSHPIDFKVNEDKSIDLKELPFLNELIKPYGVCGAARPFELFDDPKLLRTITISFSKIKKTDEFIEALKKISVIEYVEKIPVKQKTVSEK